MPSATAAGVKGKHGPTGLERMRAYTQTTSGAQTASVYARRLPAGRETALRLFIPRRSWSSAAARASRKKEVQSTTYFGTSEYLGVEKNKLYYVKMVFD
jgi:hypothetical protein